MSTVARNKSKNKKSKDAELVSDEKIDEIVKDITLKRPRNAFTQFVLNEVEQIKSKNKNANVKMSEWIVKFAEKWQKLKDSEKKKYQKLYEEEKAKFKSDIELVRHYLFKDFNDNVHSAPTAYRIFLNEKLREGFEKGSDPKEIKKGASSQWNKMSDEEKKIYYDKKKENDNWFLKAKQNKKITPITLFIQKKIEEAKEKHQEPPALKDIAPLWKKLTKTEKKSYEKYAQEFNDEKEKLQDIYDIVHGIKPKRPAGAFRIFLQEKAKNGLIKSLNDGHEMWKKLSEEEKEEYLTKSHRCILAYRYKKMIYQKKIKKMCPKKPKSALQFYLKEKKGQKPANGEKWLTYWTTIYSSLSNDKKKKYEEKYKKSIEVYEKKMEKFKNKVFDMPKRPPSGFLMYVSDRMPDIKREKPKADNSTILKQIAKEWQDNKASNKAKYNEIAEKEKKRFKKQLKEFTKFGYYSRIHEDSNEEEEGEKTQKSKSKSRRKSTSKAGSQRTKKNKGSVSQKKTPKGRSRSKSKKSQKVGKSQKSKK